MISKNSIENILADTANRQYPLPERPWKIYQQWREVLMLHYRADPHALAKLLPNGLSLDSLEGEAYVSLLSLSVKGLRHRLLPPLPFLSGFNEINVRTYVIKDGYRASICWL